MEFIFMAEVAIVLAVLPLIISAAENYKNVYLPFERFRNFAPEVRHFLCKLKIQRTLFREECRLLLAQVAGNEEVKMTLCPLF